MNDAPSDTTSKIFAIRDRMNKINRLISDLQRDTNEKVRQSNNAAENKALMEAAQNQEYKYRDEWHDLADEYEKLARSG